ncbi:unnamed protein product [Adineta steineri]|uniref:Uncharacterized protein n=1 Tax=Adineta steineri TaxID=433720 RepID=A0A815CUG2_9BILA|nr:unnamed protein product [Adineta steineri]CAF1354321.1 unnamed protein product [Adineta steineri]
MSIPKTNRKRSLVELFQKTYSQGQPQISSPATSTIDQLLYDAAMTAFSYVFIAATPDHRCQLNLDHFTDTYKIQSNLHQNYINKYIPSELKDPECTMFDKNSSNKNPIPCTQWVFDDTFYNKTISTDWNFVCTRLHLKGIIHNAYIIGTSGSFLTGIMSDRLERRTTMYLLILLMVIVLNSRGESETLSTSKSI